MNRLFVDLGNRVRPLRWHYETRLLRWAGHISRMQHDRLPLMLLTSWCPNSRPIGCPRMTYGRTVKKALKRRPEIWPELPFDRPDNWETLTTAAKLRLLKKHNEAKRKHDIAMQTHWMTLAQDRGSWREMVRGPEPESIQRASASRRARSSRSNNRHNHQPVHFQPAVIPHNYQQHAGFTHNPAAAVDNSPEAVAERERLAAIRRALDGDSPYQDLLALGINPAFFGVTAPVAA